MSVTQSNRSLWPTRGWWLALLAILMVAGALRYTGYNFSLPYVDHPDEPNFNLAGRMIIDFGSPKPMNMQGYPPGIIAVNYVFLRLFHDPDTPPASVLWMVRLVSITFNMGTLIIIALLAYRIAGSLAGLLAASIWAVTTAIVEFSRFATADNFVMFFTLAALFLALTALEFNRSRWATWSIVAMMLAIVFKYQAVFVLPVVILITLWRLHRFPSERRAIWRNTFDNAALLTAFGLWLLLLFPTTEVTQVPNWVAPATRLTLPTPEILLQNWGNVFSALNATLLWVVAASGLIMMLIPQRPGPAAEATRTPVWTFGLLMIALAALAWHVGVSLYQDQEFRQFVAEAALLVTMAGVGLTGWARAVGLLLARVAPTTTASKAVGPVTVAVITAALLLPTVNATLTSTYRHTLPDRRNHLGQYMDTSLAPGPHIADQSNHKTLDGAWGGYPGVNSFPLVEVAHIDDRPIEAWRELGVMYAIEGYSHYEALRDTEAGRALLEDTVLLKAYEPSRDFRGPSMVVLRLYPMQHEAEGQLGNIELLGYDISATEVAPGESVDFTLYWRANEPPDGDYAVFNHVAPLASRDVVAQVDGDPLPDTRRPTSTWTDEDETLVSRMFTLRIGEDVPEGEYRLITGFYDRETGERLRTADGDDALRVASLRVSDESG